MRVLFLLSQQGAFERSGRGEIGDRNRDLPNVLLVIVDALRQDTLGVYGHERVLTPTIDSIAHDGVTFENAFVQAPFTWTSFGSFLTGKYPRRHGLVKMDPPELGNGLFTLAVADVMSADRKKHDLNGNGAIEVSELYYGVKKQVIERAPRRTSTVFHAG